MLFKCGLHEEEKMPLIIISGLFKDKMVMSTYELWYVKNSHNLKK